ncbi:FecR family protein [Chitinophaga alhagiae]|uniref:FecR family protein n=1 Tax=Chitinophaga alhagiae TaxID=2203219 RepID=UPI000E5B1556|nr:FecR domain-containing protein [Chitinophaga alhagiae]
MPDRFELEQLVIDDSFISYCFRRNEADILFWENYLRQHPEEAATMAEARELVMGITLMLQQEPAEENPAAPVVPLRAGSLKKIMAIAASVVLVGAAAFFLFKPGTTTAPGIAQAAEEQLVYLTAMAEKKTVRLPDSSTVILNAGSKLTVNKAFGRENRSVCLKGEALFQVEPNAGLPFIVKVEGYDVKVLGTVFNVKAYPEEKKSETSLISGKVEIYLRHGVTAYKVLKPREKFVIRKDIRPVDAAGEAKNSKSARVADVLPLSYNRKNVNLETAWSENRLVFEDEAFGEMRVKLERWFDVNIVFEDQMIEQYRFTATFEKENIVQVMKALQASYPFTCRIEGKTVKISHQHSRR